MNDLENPNNEIERSENNSAELKVTVIEQNNEKKKGAITTIEGTINDVEIHVREDGGYKPSVAEIMFSGSGGGYFPASLSMFGTPHMGRSGATNLDKYELEDKYSCTLNGLEIPDEDQAREVFRELQDQAERQAKEKAKKAKKEAKEKAENSGLSDLIKKVMGE